MVTRDTLESLVQGESLDQGSAAALMSALLESDDAVQVAATLIALRAKGCTGVELAAFASVLRDQSVKVLNAPPNAVDTCGTGGGRSTFNISTAAAIVTCAAGVPVTKHGNRAVTSSCGSADVLEALGVRLNLSPDEQSQRLRDQGIAFLFAPSHHPGMAKVGPVRRALGVRTVFNQLGPLANPAGCKRQVIGVYDPSFLRPMAEALLLLGTERGLVVHGAEGLDEISPCRETLVCQLLDGEVSEFVVMPEQLGIDPVLESALDCGATAEENAAILREAISDADSLRSHALLPSAGAAVWLGSGAQSWAEGVRVARETIRSGKALAKLESVIG